MALKKIKNMTVTTGEYTASDGEVKKRYLNIGSVFEREDGSICFKLDSIPVHAEWDGWGNCYDPQPYKKEAQSTPPQQRNSFKEEDDIPF